MRRRMCDAFETCAPICTITDRMSAGGHARTRIAHNKMSRAHHAEVLMKGARRGRQALYAGRGQRPRPAPQERVSRHGSRRADPTFYVLSWARHGRHPALRPRPTPSERVDNALVGRAGGSVQACVVGEDKLRWLQPRADRWGWIISEY